MTTPTTQRISLSEIKEHLSHLSIKSWFAEATRRQRIEAAVLMVRSEHAEAAEYERLRVEEASDTDHPIGAWHVERYRDAQKHGYDSPTDAEWAALHTPVVATDGEVLPW
jgi:hypothetical protein